MATIIRLDPSRRRPGRNHEAPAGCRHANVICYTAWRLVCCTDCGAELDPFDVLVQMVKAAPPPAPKKEEALRLVEEVKRRRGGEPDQGPEAG
ncbi:MAG: hypothetical protein AB1634_16860 [Thermodesulfobacteriota bacterium]